MCSVSQEQHLHGETYIVWFMSSLPEHSHKGKNCICLHTPTPRKRQGEEQLSENTQCIEGSFLDAENVHKCIPELFFWKIKEKKSHILCLFV